MATTPIRLQTLFGSEQYNILYKQAENYKQHGFADEFKQRCEVDAASLTEYLNFFLEDDNMVQTYPMTEDDKVGWKLYREMSDMISALNYFSGKRP